MRIAICDDSQQDLAVIARCISRITEFLFEYDIYSDPHKLLKAGTEEQKHYDLYIFDIEMPQMNGLSLAKEIRKTDAKALFCFLTSYSGYMKYVFDVITLDFIEKPISETRLKALITKSMDQLQFTNQNFSFSYRKGRHSLRYDEILYIEKKGRQALIHTEQTIYKTNMTLEELWSQLDERLFAQINTSFILNLKNLISAANGEAQLINKECLYITKGYRKSLTEKHMNFVKGGM